MSDFQMGPGWWQASDGKWYPPAGAAPPPQGMGAPAPTPSEKKRSKAPLLLGIFCGIPLLLVLVIGLAASLGSDDEEAGSGSGSGDGDAAAATDDCEGERDAEDTRNLCLYPGRPDRQDEDHEAEVGQSVRLSGYTATVTGSEVVPGLLDGQVLVVDVIVENRDDAAQPYNSFDWRLQTPGGQVIDPWGIADGDDRIGTGDLVSGGTVEGTVSFDVDSTGDHFLIYKPDAFNAARGIWQVTVSPDP